MDVPLARSVIVQATVNVPAVSNGMAITSVFRQVAGSTVGTG